MTIRTFPQTPEASPTEEKGTSRVYVVALKTIKEKSERLETYKQHHEWLEEEIRREKPRKTNMRLFGGPGAYEGDFSAEMIWKLRMRPEVSYVEYVDSMVELG